MHRWEIPLGVRFVTFSCQHRRALLSDPKTCELFLGALARARADLGLEVFAWVLMPEHVHLMCRPRPSTTLKTALVSVKMSVSRRVLARWHSTGNPILADLKDTGGRARFWLQGGGFDRNVRSEAEFADEIRYIHHNPVKRGLVSKPEDWRWSSVRWWMGRRDGEFECDPPPGRPGQWDGWKGFM